MISATIEQWKRVLKLSDLKYKQDKNSLRFTIGHVGSLFNASLIVVRFENKAPHLFQSISYEELDENIPNAKPKLPLSDWMKLLQDSKIYYALKEFRNTKRRWVTYWLELECKPIDLDSINDPVAMRVSYDRKDMSVLNVITQEIY